MMKTKKKDGAAVPNTKGYLSRRILDYFDENEGAVVSFHTISKWMGIQDRAGKLHVGEALQDLAAAGTLLEVAHGRYQLVDDSDTLTGILSIDRKGMGTIQADGDIVVTIPPFSQNHALHGDTVKVTKHYNEKYKDYSGRVIQIVKRGKTHYVGTLVVTPVQAFLHPDDRKMPCDILIPFEDLSGAQDGDRALVEFTTWPSSMDAPFGRVVTSYGPQGDNNAEMHAILASYDLPTEYPALLTEQAKRIPDQIPDQERTKRRDFTKVTTFTIDPETAKDFDDAISLRALEHGDFEVGVHIADVTYYVTQDSRIDQEAYNRATSIYLVDRTIPMLPEHLSNFLCSLRPQEEKLTFSVVFTMDSQANVKDYWIGRTIICSQARMTYEQAQAAIEGADNPLGDAIRTLHHLAAQLRERRFAQGAIDFPSEDVRFRLDPHGKPLEVIPEVYNESHQLIEEFMLLANRTVAEFIGKLKGNSKPRPFVYRIHDKPDPEKLQVLLDTLGRLGIPYQGDVNRFDGHELNKILHATHGTSAEDLVGLLALRAMAKAIYSTTNIGHYGLAFEYYTHFTSPIRRYPDMMVHRILAQALAGESSPTAPWLEERCDHASEMERMATDAERDSIKYKQVEYLGQYIGQRFPGVVSGMAGFGFFVELEQNKCEGLVAVRDLTDDFYVYNEDSFQLVGEHTHRVISLGDRVEITVLRVSLEERHIDFALYAHQGQVLTENPNSHSRHRATRAAADRKRGGHPGKGKGQRGSKAADAKRTTGRSKHGPAKRKGKHR